MSEKDKTYVDPRNAHTNKYSGVMAEIVEQRICPFCPESFHWHTKPILRDDGLWIITENMQPYEHAQYHFLIIGKSHKENFAELTGEDFASIAGLVNWANEEYHIEGGGITMRFGDTLYTGATVKHLHAHLIVPIVEDGKPLPVWFPVG